HRSVRLVILVGLAIDQIAQSGLSSLSVIYYSAQLFSNNIVALFRAFLVGASFRAWGVSLGWHEGAEWRTTLAGKIALLFSGLGFIYNFATLRSTNSRARSGK
ncbi:hypothetical protein, partial [Serratia nevei]